VVSVTSNSIPGLYASEDVLLNLFYTLGELENLKKLEIHLGFYPDELYLAHFFLEKNFQPKELPRVQTLRMIHYNSFLWKMCPNVESLSTDEFPSEFTVASLGPPRPSTQLNLAASLDLQRLTQSRLVDISTCDIYDGDSYIKAHLKGDFSKIRHLRLKILGNVAVLHGEHASPASKQTILCNTYFPADLVEAAPRLETLDLTSTGVAFLDLAPRLRRGLVSARITVNVWTPSS
jgi:hypothetical protein